MYHWQPNIGFSMTRITILRSGKHSSASNTLTVNEVVGCTSMYIYLIIISVVLQHQHHSLPRFTIKIFVFTLHSVFSRLSHTFQPDLSHSSHTFNGPYAPQENPRGSVHRLCSYFLHSCNLVPQRTAQSSITDVSLFTLILLHQ